MATQLTPFIPCRPNAGTPGANAADVTFAAGDPTGNTFVSNGRDYIWVRNSHASNPYNFSVTAVPDLFGRTVNITNYALQASDIACLGPFTREGWAALSGVDAGKITCTPENAALLIAIQRTDT